MEWAYSEEVKKHFMDPKNVYDEKEGFEYDGKGTVGNVTCGDEMTFYVKVNKKKNTLEDCRWKTYGCASAIASTSLLSEKVKGMDLEKAYKVTPKEIMKDLHGLPEHKVHCSVLGDKALRAAIDEYYKKSGMEEKIHKEAAKVICQCMNVTDHEIEEAVLEGVRTYMELQERTKLGTVCGQCKEEALELMDKYVREHFSCGSGND